MVTSVSNEDRRNFLVRRVLFIGLFILMLVSAFYLLKEFGILTIVADTDRLMIWISEIGYLGPVIIISNPRGDGVVLLVEDEAPVRAFASRALRMRGYTVLEADSAESALKTLENDGLEVDVFVTDVIMPGLDGPTWVRQALEDRPNTRVVFISGYAEESLAENQARVPNSVFLPKPFSLTQLTNVVQSQLS